MKLQIMSDAHMQVDGGNGHDYGRFDFPVAAPNLALLGGMARICDVEVLDFIFHQLQRFENVFYVMGLDEFYGSDLPKTLRAMETFTEILANSPESSSSSSSSRELGRFHFLYRTRVDFGDVTILGCTLWRRSMDRKHERRVDAQYSFRPIKDFYAEEEQAERELDLSWLDSELRACANGEDPIQDTPTCSNDTPSPAMVNASLTPERLEEEEGDIYDDEPMIPAPRSTELPAETPTDVTEAPAAESDKQINPEQEPTARTPQSLRGPAKRVLVLTYFPPTYNETTYVKWKPLGYKDDEVEAIIKDRQCWALPDGVGNGVFVHSPLHGSGTAPTSLPNPASATQVEPSSSNEPIQNAEPCTHDERVDPSSDSLRPPGLAAWAFGYSDWSCDIQYDANKPKPPKEDSYYYDSNKQNPTPPPHDMPCPSCKRVPAPIRMVSNQRGHQWQRDGQPYVDVPVTWRAFDDAFVIDV